MKYSVKWLQDYLDFQPSEEFLDKFARCIVDIEGITSQGDHLDGIIVGKIIRIQDHPNADSLKIATIDTRKKTNSSKTEPCDDEKNKKLLKIVC